MNITFRGSGETTIMDLTGHIDLSSSPRLRKSMLDCLKKAEHLGVNLGGVKYIDSSGIASLLEVLKEARKTGRRFVLFGLTAGVREVLQLTRLTGVFEVYEDEQAALAAVPGQGSGRP
jgi:anti-sigma B factor antagonist